MKLTTIILTVLAGMALATQGFALNVTDNSGAVSVDVGFANFTNWATAGGATVTGDFTTNNGQTTWGSGPSTGSGLGSISIPFTFSGPIQTLTLDYSAMCASYGNNEGYVQLDAIVGATDTEIFRMSADDGQAQYNYTTSQTPNPGSTYTDAPLAGVWAGWTDISPLVAGQSSFTLEVTCATGWSPWYYNGGQFLSDRMTIWGHPGQDFLMTGTVAAVPEPASALALLTGLVSAVGFLRRRK